jgi:hypothetical protein
MLLKLGSEKFSGTQILTQELHVKCKLLEGNSYHHHQITSGHGEYITSTLSSTHIMFCVFYDHEDRALKPVHLPIH